MVKLYDVTLRDGNHAARHKISPEFVQQYCRLSNGSGVHAVEVGHGNGAGASSYLVGKSKYEDYELFAMARSALVGPKLAIHSIPGFATISRDIFPAIDAGVELVRVAAHVTEVDVTAPHIDSLRGREVEVQGVMMMSHTVDVGQLVESGKKLEEYGAESVIFMDSAGNYIPHDVTERVRALTESLSIEVGFHAHNNLGLGIVNAIAAFEAGCDSIDGSSMGLGAGSGNAMLEGIVALLLRLEFDQEFDLDRLMEMSRLVETELSDYLPRVTGTSIRSGNAGVFSGYAPQVREIASEFGLDQHVLWTELGRRKLVAGQESVIREVAQDLMNL